LGVREVNSDRLVHRLLAAGGCLQKAIPGMSFCFVPA